MKDNKQYVEAKSFLSVISQGNLEEEFHFQTFDDHKESKRPQLNKVLVGTFEQHFHELVKLNNNGAGVFVTINKIENSRKREAKSVSKIRAVFADKDDGDFNSFPILPTMVVQTKNGQHAYWVTNEVSRDNFTDLQKSIINTLKTDPQIHDLPRVMRLPGFYHRKNPNEIFYVKTLTKNNHIYLFNELTSAFPKIETKILSVNALKGTHDEIIRYLDRLEGAIQGEAGDLKTFQTACALVRGFNLPDDDALTYLKKYNEKCSPRWSDSDLASKIKSARKSGSGDFGYLLKNLTTEQWVYRFLERNKVKVSYNKKTTFNGEIIQPVSLIRKAEIQWDNENKKSKIGVITSVLEEWELESRSKIVDRARKWFAFNPKIHTRADKVIFTGLDPLSQFTQALVGKDCEDFLQHRAVLGHFLWQVKRKLFRIPTAFTICPVLVGKQGSGKSRALDNLTAPLKDFCMDGSLDLFSRESEKFAFGTYYIIKLDEFSGVTKSELESVKQLMDSESVNFRTYYTQTMAHMPNISTFIGASNRSVADVIRDQTGNRRFYEIPCLDRLDWNLIGGYSEDEGIDYNTLWQSIDENDESPLMPFKNAVDKYQEGFRAKSMVEIWLGENFLIPKEGDSKSLTSAKQLHRDFTNWLKEQNSALSYTVQSLGRELTKFLEPKHKNDGAYYFVKNKNLPTIEHKAISEKILTTSLQSEDEKNRFDIEAFLAQSMNTKIKLSTLKK